MPPNLVKSSGSTKLLQCTLCSKKFSRTDHLKRHQLRHTGIKPYSCVFCSDGFTRSDNLRDHYPSCPQRQNRPIPEAARGGRRSHACDSCTSMKLGCDGKNPCNTCRQKKIECKYVRLQSKGLHVRTESQEVDAHRGSINFLLNARTANSMDCFRFPATAERRNIYIHKYQQSGTDLIDQHSGSESSLYENEFMNWNMMDNNNYPNFMSGPFSKFPTELSPASQIALSDWEPPSVQSTAIIQCLRERAVILYGYSQQQSELDQHLNFIFTPSKIIRFVNEAFQNWHPTYPFIHTPSFSIETAFLPLLAVITVIGARYSRNDAEVNSARSILELVEDYIFSLDDLSVEYQTMQSGCYYESPFSLASLQAAYMMVILQSWTGSITSKNRIKIDRFKCVVLVARSLHLIEARHDENDLMSEALWIEKECRIRLMHLIYHFDCALFFFARYPRRLASEEMNFDLMCDDRFFFSHHPFSEPRFLPSRNMTTSEALLSLVFETPVRLGVGTIENPSGLNSADMFTLIHSLLVSVQSISMNPFIISNLESMNCLITNLKSSLARWHSIWTGIRANILPETVVNDNLSKNALNYWMIAQVILTDPNSANSYMSMENGNDVALSELRNFQTDNSIPER